MTQNALMCAVLRSWRRCLIVVSVIVCIGITGITGDPSRAATKDPRADKLMVVDCLLPGQIRKLGSMRTFLTPRRPIKTTQSECEIRGGEYVEFDRADYSTALEIWLPQAKQGDPEAQNYIGEIFEKGLGTVSDYEAAASWYRKAAEQDYSRAQINLGQLYELGHGVPQDMREALNWYRRASGLEGDDLQFASSVRVTLAAKDQQIERLQQRTQRSEEEAAALRQQLAEAESQLKGRQSELDAARNKLTGIRKQLKEQDAVIRSAQDQAGRALQRELEQEQERLDAKRAELKDLEANLKSEAAQLTAQQREAVEQNNRLQSTLLQKQTEADRLRVRLQTLNDELEGARGALTEDASQDAAIMAQLKAVEEERSALTQQLADSDQQVAALSGELEGARQSLDATAVKYAEALNKLEQRKVLHDIEIRRLQQERDQMAQQAEVDVAEIDKLKAELKKQETQYAEQIRALEANLENQGAQLTAQQREAVERNNRLQSTLLQKQTEADRLRARLQALNNELEGTRGALREDASQDAAMMAQLKAVEEERSALTQQLMDSDQQVAALSGELEGARQSLDATATKYAEALNELEQRKVLHDMETRRLQQERDQLAEQAEVDVAEINKLKAELEKQEAQYTEQIQTLTKKYNESQARVQQVAQQLSAAVAPAPGIEVAATGSPAIELIEPPVTLARGAYTASVAEDIEKREIIGKVTAPAGVLRFNINEEPAELDATGLFSQWITIAGSKTPVSMVVVDRQGQRVSLDFNLFRRVDEVANDRASDESSNSVKRIGGLGDYHALVIGNSSYSNFPQLITPSIDAKEVTKVLKEKYGYKTKLLLDANRYDILSALNEYRKKLNKEDNLLVYYAGHGEIDDVNAQGYWLPVDSEKDNSANWISTRSISDILNIMSAKHVMVVADSCYSGAMTRSALARLQAGKTYDEWVKWYKKVSKLRTRMVLSSGGEEPVNDGGGGKHSLFAQAFLQALRENDAVLDGYKLYLRIAELTKQRINDQGLDIRQSPQYAPIQFAGHEAGEFLFQRVEG